MYMPLYKKVVVKRTLLMEKNIRYMRHKLNILTLNNGQRKVALQNPCEVMQSVKIIHSFIQHLMP